ncbi:MAG: hypothetical protein ACJ72S_18370 [Nitrososphaeraceae archaeon]
MASRRDNIERKDNTTTFTSSDVDTTTSSSQQEWQQREREEQQHQAINRALDETKDNIRKTTDEARSQIPRYTQSVKNYQEQTIQAAREIADNYLDSQREIINTFQSACIPQIENTNKVFWSNWMSPRQATELYANMVSSFANNMIAATNLVNNMIFANMEALKTSIQQAKDNTKELSRIGVNTAKTFEQTSRDSITRQGGNDTPTARVSVETEEQGQDRARRRF